MADLKDETGITLTELLAVIVLLAVITTLVTTMASHVFTIRNVQESKVKAQAIANRLYADLNTYSNQTLVNTKKVTTIADNQGLGEAGKYRGTSWADRQIVRLLDDSNNNTLTYDSAGVAGLKLTTHKDNSELNTYQTPSKKIKMKVYLAKNKHENQVLKQGESNFRESFSVETTVYVVFYKGTIDWGRYIPNANKPMAIEDVKRDNTQNIVYTRVFDISYRDDAKSAGEVAGNGRW